MSHGKQFTLFNTDLGPNGWKVDMVLRELGLSYETKWLSAIDLRAGKHREPEFTKYNPNGRIPVLIDHSYNDFVVWESDAILYYLVEKYDTEHKISAETFDDRIMQQQWLFFQASGQGPYFGQAGWFLHVGPPEQRNAVVAERYQKEILRVFGVLEGVLSHREWLVSGKCTICDIAFVIWNEVAISMFLPGYNDFNFEKDFPTVYRWHTSLTSRPTIKASLELRQEKIAEVMAQMQKARG